MVNRAGKADDRSCRVLKDDQIFGEHGLRVTGPRSQRFSKQCDRYRFQAKPKSHGNPVVSVQRPASRTQADAQLAERMRRIHAEHEGTYGSPRMTAELRAAGMEVNHKRVERMMRERCGRSCTPPASAWASVLRWQVSLMCSL
jgi:hypothetical protein